MWFGEFNQKGSCILKNTINKIRNGQDNVTWILTNVQAALNQHWGSIDFHNKSSTAKANQAIDKEASVYCGGSISTVSHYEKWLKSFNDYQASQPDEVVSAKTSSSPGQLRSSSRLQHGGFACRLQQLIASQLDVTDSRVQSRPS
ncbi:hypothetical protein CR513_36420, partial [Mucuna pruriens]